MLHLQPFTIKDFDQLISWVSTDAFLLQWGGPAFTYPLTTAQLHQYIFGANVEDATTYVFKAIDSTTNACIGHISIGRVDRIYRCARIGKVLIAPEQRGNGYGEQLMNAALTYAFDELQLERVTLGVFDFNEAAIQCYEKVGFIQHRFIENARAYHNTYWHLIEMELTKERWLAIQRTVTSTTV